MSSKKARFNFGGRHERRTLFAQKVATFISRKMMKEGLNICLAKIRSGYKGPKGIAIEVLSGGLKVTACGCGATQDIIVYCPNIQEVIKALRKKFEEIVKK